MISPSTLISAALIDVGDTRLPRPHRVRTAHLVAYLHPDAASETTTAEVLATAMRCLSVTSIARSLVIGVWRAYGEDPLVATWTDKLVERACAQDHRRTAATLCELLGWMEGFDGRLSEETGRKLAGFAWDPQCQLPLFDFAWRYEHRFGTTGLPAWVTQIRDDPRVLKGASVVPASTRRPCPVCRLVPLHYFPRTTSATTSRSSASEARRAGSYRGG